MPKLLTPLALAVLAASPALAQVTADPGAMLKSEAAASRIGARPESSCVDAHELETSFQVTLAMAGEAAPRTLAFAYARCREEGRNDYQPPYTERDYDGPDGWGLVIVTDQGADRSDVLLAQGRDWAGNFGGVANAALLSGKPVALGAVRTKDGASGAATLSGAPAAAKYPQLALCEAALAKEYKSSPRDAAGDPVMGYGGPGPSLVLLTGSDAYYYHEDCDICAAVARCELATGKVSDAVTAHAVGCEDMARYRTADALYDACRR